MKANEQFMLFLKWSAICGLSLIEQFLHRHLEVIILPRLLIQLLFFSLNMLRL